jgi:16S rRNA processing protein RimM
MEVVTEEGRVLGKVEAILPTRSNDVYLVQGGKREWLIPATEEVIVQVDRQKGRIVIHPIEGLLEA